MIRPLLLAAALAVAQPGPAASPTPPTVYPVRMLTPAQAQADVALLRRAMETIHPGLYRYRTKAEIDAAFARLEAVAAAPVTDLQLWRALAEMVAEIHCDHSKPEPSDALQAWRDTHNTMLPLRVTFLEGRMIVVANDGQPGAPPRGAEITAINGRPVPMLVDELARAVAYDGDTDQAILAKLESDSDLTGDDLNEYWPSFYGFPTSWEIAWKRPGDVRAAQATLHPIGFKAWTAIPAAGETWRNEFYKAVGFRVAGKAAYLRIDTFVNYRNPVDATAFLGGFFKTMKARGTEHLILDLRANGGGSEDVSVALGRYLIPQPFVWSKPVRFKAVRYGDLPEHLDSWGDPKELYEPPLSLFTRTADGWWDRNPRPGNEDDESVLEQRPVADAFRGRLTLLTGPENASGATRTAAQLKARANARIVGEEGAGSAEGPTSGRIFLLTLPNSGLKVRIASAWNRTNVPGFVLRRGVPVDDLVTPTLADFEASRDRAYDFAKATAPAPPAPELSSFFSGRWTGVLDYRDFRSDRRVALQLTAEASATGAGVRLQTVIDDGPGKTIRGGQTWSLSAGALTLTDGDETDRYAVVERRAGGKMGEALTLVATGRGQENDRPVDVRLILTRDAGRLRITRATRSGHAPFLMRHAYDLRLAP